MNGSMTESTARARKNIPGRSKAVFSCETTYFIFPPRCPNFFRSVPKGSQNRERTTPAIPSGALIMNEARHPVSLPNNPINAPESRGPTATETETATPKKANALARASSRKYC